jgi:hypothetical protein
MHDHAPVANGLRTDHPIPDLPFVDDSCLPVDDPRAIAAIGRNKSPDMWGREDRCGEESGWAAFTTDATRHDLGWCVRWHPVHGRSVVLYRKHDAASVHDTWGASWRGFPLLFRAGGYWWDGFSWYRPSQVWDRASENYVRRVVPAASTVTAADLLSTGEADPRRGKVLDIDDVDLDVMYQGRWLDDLALWAVDRGGDGRALSECVVRVTAPELSADQLLGVAEMAEVAGVAPSTLRAYLSRGENEVPPPQAVVGGRSMWSRPVAEEWAEQRRRSSTGAADAMTATDRDGASISVGVSELWHWFTQMFFGQLWENPNRRKRWALRWRTREAVRDAAAELGWSAAVSLDRVIPMSALAVTIRHAILDELAYGQKLDRATGSPTEDFTYYGITPQVAEMFDWLIRHDPGQAADVIGEVVGEASRRFEIPRPVTENSLRTTLALDGKLRDGGYAEFLDRALPPSC